jgi:hypothetical protein
MMRVGLSLMLLGMRAAGAAGLRAGSQRFIHDFLDGACTAAALRAATEAAIHLPGGTRHFLDHGITYVVVSQDVTGTNDHGLIGKPVRTLIHRYFNSAWDAKAKRPVLSYSKLGDGTPFILELI